MVQKIFMTLTLMLACLSCFLPAVWADPGVSAQSAIVLEKDSGRVLYQKNAEKQMPMASTTKIMTAIVALEQGDPAAQVQISPAAAGVEGSSMYLETGEKLTLEELLYGLMLSSGNDAAVAIAEHFGGTEAFVGLMNQKAQEIGANNTHFANPNGLPDDTHYSTSHDMATITAYGLKNPKFAEIVATKSYQIAGEGKAYTRTLTNHNKLLNICEGCIGVKTGFTKAAGRCLVSAAQREDMTLICVTLNAPDDWNDHCNLYQDMFSKYKLTPILRAGKSLGDIAVLDSDTASLPISSAENYSYPLTEGEQCITTLSIKPDLEAPVADGTDGGTVTVQLGQANLATLPLTVNGTAEKRPVLEKVKRGLRLNLGELYWGWLTLLHF